MHVDQGLPTQLPSDHTSPQAWPSGGCWVHSSTPSTHTAFHTPLKHNHSMWRWQQWWDCCQIGTNSPMRWNLQTGGIASISEYQQRTRNSLDLGRHCGLPLSSMHHWVKWRGFPASSLLELKSQRTWHGKKAKQWLYWCPSTSAVECVDILYYSMVWTLFSGEQKNSPGSHKHGSENNWTSTALAGRYLQINAASAEPAAFLRMKVTHIVIFSPYCHLEGATGS